MKMSNEAFRALRDAVLPTMQDNPVSFYIEHDMGEGVWRWHCLWRSQIEGQSAEAWVNDRLYKGEGLNDDHIDTALRRIAAEARGNHV